jgi:hypothetical protein
VIIGNLYLKSIPALPQETDTILIIDPNAMLSPAISAKRLQLVPWWNSQVVERDSCIQNGQFLKGPPPKIGRQPAIIPRPP